MRKSDLYWVKKLRSNQARDFHAFFDHFFPRLYRFALSRSGEPRLAEEAVQEALGKGIININSYLGEAALFTWLCTITRHEIGRILSRESLTSERMLQWEDETLVAVLDSLENISTDDPQIHYDKMQVANLVRSTMAGLPTHYADVLEWRYLQGHSVAEIATKLNKSYKAAESLLSRSRDVFRDAFLAIVDSGWDPEHGEER